MTAATISCLQMWKRKRPALHAWLSVHTSSTSFIRLHRLHTEIPQPWNVCSFSRSRYGAIALRCGRALTYVPKMLSELKDLIQKGLFTQVRRPHTTVLGITS